MIERIEVVKGGASTPVRRRCCRGRHQHHHQDSGRNFRYGPCGLWILGYPWTWDFLFGGKQDKTGFQVGINRNKASYLKYKDTNGDTKRWDGQSNYTQDALSLKLTQDFTKSDGLTVNYDYSNLEGNLLAGLYDYSYQPNADQRHTTKKTNNVGIKYDWNRDSRNSGYLQAYRNYLNYSNFGAPLYSYNDGGNE